MLVARPLVTSLVLIGVVCVVAPSFAEEMIARRGAFAPGSYRPYRLLA